MTRLPRKLALSTCVLLLAGLGAELGARVVASVQGRAYSGVETAASIRESLSLMTDLLPGAPEDEEGPAEKKKGEILYAIHPYTGFDTQSGLKVLENCVRYFREGEGEEEFTVFVMGGSVAAIFAGWSRGAIDRLKTGLAEHPALEGRPVRTFRLAVPGFKQPQQLMQLTYLLSRGCEPDLVINLDGFNEVNSGVNNAIRKLQPTYPSFGHWAELVAGKSPDGEALRLLVDVTAAQERARAIAAQALDWGFAHSCLLGRMTLGRLERVRGDWTRAQERYLDHLTESHEDDREKPFGVEAAADGALAEAIDCWYESSLAMQQLCAARGILYLHAIQPTLHDVGSKELVEDEIRRGVGDRGWNPNIVEGYPILRERCRELREHGVDALDATMVFADVGGLVYYDNCHFGKRGNKFLADFLLVELARMLER